MTATMNLVPAMYLLPTSDCCFWLVIMMRFLPSRSPFFYFSIVGSSLQRDMIRVRDMSPIPLLSKELLQAQ